MKANNSSRLISLHLRTGEIKSDVKLNCGGGSHCPAEINYGPKRLNIAKPVQNQPTGLIESQYPNPVSDHQTIVLRNQAGDIQINLFDQSGRTIQSYSYSNKRILELETTELTPGIYFLEIKADDKREVRKFRK